MHKTLSPEDEKTLTRMELAQRWKCSTETVRRREREKLLPALKFGRTVRYRLSDILRVEAEAVR